MKIVLVTPPPSEVHAQRAAGLLQQAVAELGHECIVLPGKELPGALQFFERRKQVQALRDLQPGVVIYCSAKNFLHVNGLKSIVVTDAEIKFCDDEAVTIARSDKEYFFYTGDVDEQGQWERVLQAYSQFKKWQQSGLQLVCGGHIDPKFNKTFQEKLAAYKYRHDVVIEQSPHLAATAFCVITTADFFDERMDILAAFRAGIPVIAHDSAMSRDFCGDTALYANFNDPKLLSQQMIAVYKNEAMYNHLSEKGKLVSSGYSRQQMLEELSEYIQQAVEQ